MADRINKFIAERLGVSRREADDMVTSGRATIDGATAAIGARVEPHQTVRVDDKPLADSAEYVYVAFHKPVGYVCSRRAQSDASTIYDLLPKKYRSLKTAGRLDKDSSGLLLLSNDGNFIQQMTHPSNRKRKVYEVTLDQPLQPLHRQMISDFGVMLEDGVSQFELERLKEGTDTRWQITMSEGRNRQIRRTFAALGYTVTALHRTEFGNYALDTLKVGDYVEIRE